MSYYREKREAIVIIEKLIKDQKAIEIDRINLILSRRFGFGPKLLKDHLKMLSSLGEVTIADNTIYLVEK